MLLIRKEQLEVLARESYRHFQRSLIPHITEHFPKHAEFLGDDALVTVIESACRKAESHGFESERDLCLFTDLCIMLGAGFDSDPQLAWASDVLDEKAITAPGRRMDLLWDKAMDYMEKVLGPDEVFPVKSYQLAFRTNLDDLDSSGKDFEEKMVVKLTRIWPEKMNVVGIEPINSLFQTASKAAETYDIHHIKGRAEFVLLMFLLGHQFYHDPMYFREREILEDRDIRDDREKMTILRNKLKTDLEKGLA